MKKIIICILVFLVSILLYLHYGNSQHVKDNKCMTIVATTSMLADAVRTIVGNTIFIGAVDLVR